jgi:hypothetical protein
LTFKEQVSVRVRQAAGGTMLNKGLLMDTVSEYVKSYYLQKKCIYGGVGSNAARPTTSELYSSTT